MGDVDVLALRYGQKLRLCAPSAYAKDAAASPELGIGYYEKQGRHGILSAVPPLGNDLDVLFNEDEYLVLDPQNLRAPGDVVEYGHTVVLVNQHGMVWNNKTGGITGYVGPRPRGIPGEMFVSFRRGNSKDAPLAKGDKDKSARAPLPVPTLDRDVSTSSTSSSSSMSTSDTTVFAADGPVHFGDTNVAITVMESNRHSNMFNKRLTNFKKPTSQIVGGYICCDGKGSELRFTLRPAKPKVEQIAMLNKLITAYNYGQKIALPMGILLDKDHAKTGLQHADILFKLSNQTTATLAGETLHEKILRHASQGTDAETEFTLPLANGPGELVLKLTGVVPKRALAKLVAASRKGPQKPSIQAAAIPAAATLPPRLTPLQRLGALVRKLPVPAFALLYAFLTHFLWRTDGTESPVRTQVATAVLLLVPAVYVASRVDHPLSSLFHAPAREIDGAGSADEEAHANVSLKLIITEYRFTPGAGGDKQASSASTDSGSSAPALVAPGSTDPVPLRYIKAEKGDEVKGRERYVATLAWRQENELDTILSKAWPQFRLIKTHYPHYYHKRGLHGEPVYYEKPGKINLKALKAAGVTLTDLLHNYLMVSEFLWQVLEPDDNKKCISVLDVDGIGISDFAGEAVEYVRNTAAVSGGHYPERCAYIFVINVPSWFSMVWNVVKTMMDEVTRDKVIIVRGNKQKILDALAEKIPLANIPEEYGGESMGMAAEETLLYNLMAYVNGESGTKTNPIDDYRREQALRAKADQADQA
jgi:hypothetical protein